MDVFKRLATWLGLSNKRATVLCVGLDNSGKTTVINHFKPPQVKYPMEIITNNNKFYYNNRQNQKRLCQPLATVWRNF